MEESQNLICIGQISDVGIPTSVKQTISETSNDEYEDQDWIRRMKANDNVCDEMTSRTNQGYSSLTETNVDEIIQSSASDIPNERGQEDERNNKVSDAIELFELQICVNSVSIVASDGKGIETYIRYDGLRSGQHSCSNPTPDEYLLTPYAASFAPIMMNAMKVVKVLKMLALD